MSSSSKTSSTSSSSSFPTSSNTPVTTSIFTPPPQHTFQPTPTGGGIDGQQQNNNNNNNGTIATSASLYLYTFLATLVLLLSVSAAIVIRSFVLRRRHRLMVEEAIRNGTWVPPSPPTRPVKVDLSKKPKLWEAYIDGKGDIAGYPAADVSSIGEKKINGGWKMEQTKEWDTIKPIAAAYLAPSASPPTGVRPSGLSTIPSAASLQNPLLGVPDSSPPSGPRAEVTVDATSLSVPSVTTTGADAGALATAPAPATSVGERRRRRAFFTRAIQLLNPTPNPTSPLPASLTRSNAGSNANLPGSAENGNSSEMTELKVPKVMRIAVLIAMPSPPQSSALSASSSSLSSAGGVIAGPSSSSSSSSSPPLPVLSSPLPPRVTPAVIHPPIPLDDDDEHPLPHLEVGVADVVVVPTDAPGMGDRQQFQKKKAAQRGSLASMATGSEVSEV